MKIKTQKIIVLCFFVLCSTIVLTAQAPYGNAGDHTPVEFGSPDTPFGYYEYLPLNFNNASSDTYALVLFYHGYGERGNGTTDLDDVLLFGPPKLIQQGSDFEAIIISPQNSDANYSASDFLNFYNYLINNYPIDLNRVYVTGLSSGGASTWGALQGHYDKIAAAVPICGTGILNDPSDFLQQTPIWTFHSFNDNVIGVNNTINNVNDIANISSSVMSVYPYESGNSAASEDYSMLFDTTNQTWSSAVGAIEPADNLSFTLYKDGGHDSWTRTYNNPMVWNWMFAQSLSVLNVEEELIGFNLYPNPTSERVNIVTKDDAEKTIEIYNLAGRKIYDSLFFRALSLDVSSYSSGVYFAKVIGEDNRQKVVKIIIN
ncbi:T9SS type A sorting domain-containing protein [uncultured Winogradskyella sp.]|uniref:T9SS type A sorting domain-containing protein n=1 Tax=uncultured Winogradskyella sp. TaxID=395353 RepID=UPI0026360DC8|nr:T9SS type A sorting domain-containing protein [uncultured Winogradskyella sp.]